MNTSVEAMGVDAIVLAAGESKRMGEENKLLLPYKGEPVLRRVVTTILESDVSKVYVVVGHEQNRIRAVLEDLAVEFVENPDYEEGMGTSIRAGVDHASDQVAGYMICLSDLPLITAKEYSFLISAFQEQRKQNPQAITVPMHGGQRGNPVILSSAYRTAMLSHQGVMGCRGIVKQNPDHVQFTEMATDHVLYDIDTPEAYKGLRAKG